MKYRSTIPALTLCLLLLTACSNQPVYTGESFTEDSPYKMRFDGDAALACEGARRTLLGQGYLIESASGEEVKGRKASRSENAQNTFIEVNVVCLAENTGSTLFASAQVSEYALKKSTSSASVGVSAIGTISLPIGQSADSLVKVKEQTIDDKEFYQGFFAAVGNTMAEIQAGKAPAEPVAEIAAPEPTLALEPTSSPPPEPAAVTPLPVAPATFPAVEPEPSPVPAAAATAVLEPAPQLPEPASRPEALPASAAVAQEPLPDNAPPEDILKPAWEQEASVTPPEPVANPPASVSPSTLSPITPVTAAGREPIPTASKVTKKPKKAAPEPVPEPEPVPADPLIQELF